MVFSRWIQRGLLQCVNAELLRFRRVSKVRVRALDDHTQHAVLALTPDRAEELGGNPRFGLNMFGGTAEVAAGESERYADTVRPGRFGNPLRHREAWN